MASWIVYFILEKKQENKIIDLGHFFRKMMFPLKIAALLASYRSLADMLIRFRNGFCLGSYPLLYENIICQVNINEPIIVRFLVSLSVGYLFLPNGVKHALKSTDITLPKLMPGNQPPEKYSFTFELESML